MLNTTTGLVLATSGSSALGAATTAMKACLMAKGIDATLDSVKESHHGEWK